MQTRNKLLIILTFLSFFLLCYFNISSLGSETAASIWLVWSRLLVLLLGVYVMFTCYHVKKSNFTSFWILWFVWQTLVIFLQDHFSHGPGSYFCVVYAPLCFLLAYFSSQDEDSKKIIRFLGIAVFLFCCAFVVYIINTNIIYVFGINEGGNNLIYWPLCAFPYIFFIEKKLYKYALIVLMVILTVVFMKRTATIIVSLSLVAFIANELKSEGNSAKKIIILAMILIIIVLSYFILNHYYDYYLDNLIMRFSDIEYDRGSGRDEVYDAVWKYQKTSDSDQWIFGHGYNSILLTGQTNAHNDLLQELFEFGLIGVCFYLSLIVYLIKRTILLVRTRSSYTSAYCVSVVITIVLGAFSNLIVFYNYVAFLTFFWGYVEARLKKNGKIV